MTVFAHDPRNLYAPVKKVTKANYNLQELHEMNLNKDSFHKLLTVDSEHDISVQKILWNSKG